MSLYVYVSGNLISGHPENILIEFDNEESKLNLDCNFKYLSQYSD